MKKITFIKIRSRRNILLPFLLLIANACAFAQNDKENIKSEDWPTYNRNYSGDRYSPLNQINTTNVKGLRLLHSFDLGSDVASLQTGPVVIDGNMYFTTDTSTFAINAANGKLLWHYTRPFNAMGYLRSHRGAAFYNGKLYRGASDGHVYALDAKTGKKIWDVKLDSIVPGASIPMAPIAWNGLVFIGNAGGDQVGVTGHVYALDAQDGHLVWIFNTVPDEVKNTWQSDVKNVPITGGSFWTSFSLDAGKGVLYVSAGNPAPDFEADLRRGDNLYTNCVIAIDAKTGKMLAYIQLVKNDFHDWDVSTAPVLITTKSGRKIIASANKDGLLSVVDRTSLTSDLSNVDLQKAMTLIYQVPTTTRENTDQPLSREVPVHFKPGTQGGSEWNGAAYYPGLDLIFVGAVDWGITTKLISADSSKMIPPPGTDWFGGSMKMDEDAKGWVTGFNAKDGTVRWKYKASAPILAGVTPTAGGLVFAAAQNGEFCAFDAATGKILWKTMTGNSTGGGLISYSVNGKQYIAIAVGMKSPIWRGAPKSSSILIYGL